jgi:hypothetical protein
MVTPENHRVHPYARAGKERGPDAGVRDLPADLKRCPVLHKGFVLLNMIP